MPKMTKKQAITECKELWEAIEKSGHGKRCNELGYTICGSTATKEFFVAVRGL